MNKISNKNIPLLVGCVIALALTIITASFLASTPYIDRDGARITDLAPISIINFQDDSAQKIEQSFQTTENGLSKIEVLVSSSKSGGQISFVLTDDNNEMVATGLLDVKIKPTTQWIRLKFSPIQNSVNKHYTLSLSSNISNKIQLLAVTKAMYPNGTLMANGESLEANLAFNFFYKNGTAYQVLNERLGIYKPGIFQFFPTYLILFGLLIILASLLVYFFLREADK